MVDNKLTDLIAYLGTKARPVTMQEFKEFWAVSSDEDRKQFKSTELTPLKLTV